MRSVSAAFLTACRTSHRIAVHVDVLRNGQPVYAECPLVSGTVTLDRTAEVRGRCSLVIAASGNVGDFLTPAGNELRIYRGVALPERDEFVSLGVFRIDSVSETDPGRSYKVTGYDRAQRVREAALEDVYVIPNGTNYGTAILSLIDNGVPGLTYRFAPVIHQTPLLVFDDFGEGGRWKAALDMATAIGHDLYFDGDGICVLRPETDPTGAAVLTLTDGPGGVIVKAQRDLSRNKSYNAVIATSSGPNDPVRAVARDVDPSSPTYYYGPFGRKPLRYSSELIATLGQAEEAAAALLRRSLGISQSLQFQTVPNPALEPGDVVAVKRQGLAIDETAVIDSIELGLLPSDGMSITVRARQLLS